MEAVWRVWRDWTIKLNAPEPTSIAITITTQHPHFGKFASNPHFQQIIIRVVIGTWRIINVLLGNKQKGKIFVFTLVLEIYESFSDVPESWVWLRGNFQSGSRVLKKVFWTFPYLYLWHTMWFHAKKLLKTLKFWKSLNSKFFTLRPTARKRREPCWHEITLYAIDIDKERFRTPFLTL